MLENMTYPSVVPVSVSKRDLHYLQPYQRLVNHFLNHLLLSTSAIIMPKISSYVRTRIELPHNQGLHPAGILKNLKAEGLAVSLSSITCIIKKLRLTGSVANLPRSERPTKLSIEARAFIDQQMQKNDEMTSTKIQKKLAKHGISISSSNGKEIAKAARLTRLTRLTRSSGWSLHNAFWRVVTLSTS